MLTTIHSITQVAADMLYMTPIDAYRQAEQFKAEQRSNALSNMLRQAQVEDSQRQMQDQEALRQALSGAISPNGTMNHSGLIQAAARSGNLEGLLKIKQLQESDESKNALREVLERQTNPERQSMAIPDTGGSPPARNPSIGIRGNDHQKYLSIADELARRGMGDAAKVYYGLAKDARPELKDQKTLMQNGKRIVVNYFKDGTSQIEPYDPDAEKLHFVDTGGRVGVGMDSFTGQQKSTGMQRTMTPGEIATNARMRESQSIARQEQSDARQRKEWVYDSQRGLAINPTTREARPIIQNGAEIGPKRGETSEDERKAASWFAQADNAYKNMQQVLAKNQDAASPEALEAIMKTAPKFTGLPSMTNAVLSAERQRFNQAMGALAEAALRAATGAGITKDEAAQKINELTPAYWDKDETKKQKLDSFKIYLDSIKLRAGRALEASGGMSGSPNSFIVTGTDGKSYKFPTQQQADAYKRAAGIP